MLTLQKRLCAGLSALAIGAVLSACGGGEGSSGTTTGTGASGGGGSGGSDTTTGTGASGGSTTTSTGATGGGGTGGTPGCGDGEIIAPETCDDGNDAAGDGCDAACTTEMGWTCAGAPSDCATTCGDGIPAGAEACDDANLTVGDGCDGACAVEHGYECVGIPSQCNVECGDGLVAATEECDDGNVAPGDGCDAECTGEIGWTCEGEPSACETGCGDGIVAGAEACDDGNTAADDGCDAMCAVEPGYACSGQPSVCPTVCGDGLIIGDEGCDDGNATDGDGCSAACAIEDGFICINEPSLCAAVCGDGNVAGPEQCDDGDAMNNDGCNAMCNVEPGYACAGEPSQCAIDCGDGAVFAPETCDDGNEVGGDGCSAACGVEAGYLCTGAPSVCATVCGDAVVTGAEQCDDGNAASGDGCKPTCVVEAGWTCTGSPSQCGTTCGDGIVAGVEQCDDGNQVSGDGCSAQCTPNSGETCADPLLPSQATLAGGKYTWNVAAGAVVSADGEVACDPNTHGPDVVVAYTKTTGTLASGGKLLHVFADTPASTATGNYLNVEIKSGACASGAGESEKCLWFKDNWDSYLDVPAGTYYIWVQKNSPVAAGAPFPQVSISAEEVAAAAAEGEGCFAPYTSSSSNYTPPGGAGQPHTWQVPASINSFDMAPEWGEPGSISCDNTLVYGDIHGVDAVIQYNKASPTSVLKVDIQNLDPVLSQSDIDAELLNVCDSLSPTKISRNCRANGDTLSFTAPSPQGPVYLWVATAATGQEMNGATVQIAEIFPGPGESWPTAQPIIAGPYAISPTSTKRYDAPSCFPAAGNVHWYKYTLANDALSLRANLAGHVGVYDGGGQQRACVTDASVSPLGILGAPGDTFYIAVQSPSTVTQLTVQDVVYNGVQDVTDMQISLGTVSEFGMAVGPSELYVGDTSAVYSFPKVVGATPVEQAGPNGIGTAQLGYDLVFAGGSLFSADSTTTTNVNRLFRLFNGSAWAPTSWDLSPAYTASSPTHAIGTDGASLFMTTRRTTVSADFYSISQSAAAVPTLLGTNTSVWYVVGLAVDNLYFYVVGNGAAGEGVYRIPRSNVTAAATRIAAIDTGTLCNNIEVDAFTSPQYLYVRDASGDIQAVKAPASATPIQIGSISTLGSSSDYAMTYDKAAGALYFFETETDGAGRILKMQ